MGKNHENQMSLESFANEMILDDMAEYPNGLDTKIIDPKAMEDNMKGDDDTCKWCEEKKQLDRYHSTLRHRRGRKHRHVHGEEEDDDNEEEDDDSPLQDAKKKEQCKSTHLVDEEEGDEDEASRKRHEFWRNKRLRNRAMEAQQEFENLEEQRGWFVEPDPKILSQYGYTYMPNTLWSVPQKRPPVCITDSKCKVQPLFSSDKFTDIMEYTGVGTIMPHFEYKNVPQKENPDKQKYMQKVSELKRPNPHYFYPGWYGYDENDQSNVNPDL